ncbi:FxSxx-COOH system tetratricopeptide repeat protein [Sphaerisporangium rubeum]|uniref:Cellulose biosynthesis protein BcsQ/tetratricopeptide (TPR) repeat protein n=1 Tax=Sphaerisporangium rubeum TaxID=321317 RepID=A0A7X0M4E5_9ACTN|nr:FxSxx-COOH system tetratricopeptide repeat protein [Sphaerisporangium rubeum]MBB6471047.1 cellulose biosynthesis protein BcsQ/tetratricopeptide (TPR) repeat protein [Sphaerisporangium rubeum]
MIAFYGARTGVGKSTTLCNVALILAAAGRRVLIVDLGTEPPGPFSYLRELLPDDLGEAGEEPGRRPVPLRLDASGGVALLRRTPETFTVEEAARLRAELTGSPYDVVLLDAPANAPGVREMVSAAADQLVLCFPMSPQAVEEAARWIESARGATPQILPLAVRVDLGAGLPLAEARHMAQASGLGDDLLEIPYCAAYSVSEELAVLHDRPGAEGLRGAYEQLVTTITGGTVFPVRRVSIVYPSRRRHWAEWFAEQGTRHGIGVTLVREEDLGGTPPPQGHRWVALQPAELGEATRRRVRSLRALLVRLDGERLPDDLAGHEVVALGESPQEVLAAVPSVLGAGPAVRRKSEDERLPGSRPGLERLPRDDSEFRGRGTLLEDIRDLLSPGASGHVALVGPGGAGKTKTALEYARLFRGAYDVVWWLDAGHQDTIRAGLVDLAEHLLLSAQGDPVDAVRAHLASGKVSRWLLVCDDARSAEQVAAAVKPPAPGSGGVGHVLVTGRGYDWPEPFRQLTVREMDRDGAIGLLRDLVKGIREPDAEKVVATVEKQPLAVRLAGALIRRELLEQGSGRTRQTDLTDGDGVWQRGQYEQEVAERFVTEFGEESRRQGRRYGEQPDVYDVLVELAVQKLKEGVAGRAGEWLVEACAFLSPQGIGPGLLRSTSMLARIAEVDQRLSAPTLIDAVLRETDRYALIRAELGLPAEPVRMHRVVQESVRTRLSRAGLLDRRRLEITSVLAASAPRYMEDMATGDRDLLAELDRHLPTCGAITPGAPAEVRQWVLTQLRFLLSVGHVSAVHRARRLAEEARSAWSPTVPATHQDGMAQDAGAGQPARSTAHEELLVILARVHLRLSEGDGVVVNAERALPGLTRAYGTLHPLVLEATTILAAGLRLTGDFSGAYDQAARTLQGLRELFGANHPEVGRAMNNFARAAGHIGQFEEAVRVATDRVRRRKSLFGENDRFALHTACNIAYFYRELGRLEDARNLLRQAVRRLSWLDSPAELERLTARLGLAVTERRLGRLTTGLLQGNDQTLAELHAEFGPSHPLTMAGEVSANADRHVLRMWPEAAAGAARTLRRFRGLMGDDHPFTHICRANLAVYLTALGEFGDAESHSTRAMDGLLARLGDLHPFYLAVTANHAGVLAARGRWDEAIERERTALSGLVTVHGHGHPTTRLVKANLSRTESHQVTGREAVDIEIPS